MAQPQRQPLKRTFKTPEGRFQLITERPNGCSFSSQRPTRLTFARLVDGHHAGLYVIFNVQECLHICYYTATEKIPTRTINFGMAASGALIVPTCHAHTPAQDSADLLIGLSTGDVLVASLQAQLLASQVNQKLLSFAHYNADQCVDATRAVAVAWLPQSRGERFVAAHASGTVYVYQKGKSKSSGGSEGFGGRTLGGGGGSSSAGSRGPISTLAVCDRGLTHAALSPDGSRIATAARDGVVRVHDLASGALLTGYRTYYGNALCCAWSPDGRWLAAGGEDDLVALFSTEEGRVVAWGEGHTSWVSALAFDPWAIRQREAAPAALVAAAAPPPEGGGAEGGIASAAEEAAAAEEARGSAAGASGQAQQAAASSSQQQQQQQAESAPPVKPELLLRVAAVGHDCNICMWDFAVPHRQPQRTASSRLSAADGAGTAHPPPQQQLPSAHSGRLESSAGSFRRAWDGSPTAREGSPKFLAKLSSGLGRDSASSHGHSQQLPGQQQQQAAHGGHRRSDSSSSSGIQLPPEIAASVKRRDMTFVPAVMVQRGHSEPASDLFFMKEALFTACHGGSVKCWHRLKPQLAPAPKPAPALAPPPQQLQPPALARPPPQQQQLHDGPRAASL